MTNEDGVRILAVEIGMAGESGDAEAALAKNGLSPVLVQDILGQKCQSMALFVGQN